MMEKTMRAKLIGKINRRFYSEYELECIDCGKHYFRQKVDYRTTPYCAWCQKKHDKAKQNERANKKVQDQINEVIDKIRAEIEELDRYFDNDYFSTNNCPMYKCNEVLLIIDKYKAESEEKE